jgi:Ca-activated chloride channel family protein
VSDDHGFDFGRDAMKLPRVRLFALISASLLFACERFPDPRLFVENKLGQKFMEAQNFIESRDHFIAALEYDPFRPELHSNLGMGFLLSQDPDKALQSFKKSEELSLGSKQEAPLKFVNRFNQGVVQSMQSKIDEALAAYQGALEVNPDSVETKTNIELLIQSQQQQQGEGDSKDSESNQGNDSKEKSDKSKDGQDQKQKDPNDDSQKDDKQKDKKDKNREYKPNQKYQPREFKGEMNQSDVNKILGEIKSQEQKIRANYNKSEAKDKPRDKDW